MPGRLSIVMEPLSFKQSPDRLAVERLRRRCRRTQEQVYQGYADASWTLALRLTGCRALAWDVVQDAFVQAFDQVGKLRDPGAFGVWLRRIIASRAMDMHRRRRREVESEPETEPAGPSPDPTLIDLERALAVLHPTDRLVLWLHDAEGLTHDEIAQAAGHTRSWSKSRLVRARARLRKLMNSGIETPGTLDAGLEPTPGANHG